MQAPSNAASQQGEMDDSDLFDWAAYQGDLSLPVNEEDHIARPERLDSRLDLDTQRFHV